MEILPTDWCAVSMGGIKKNNQKYKHLAKVPIFMQSIKLSRLMCVHCI